MIGIYRLYNVITGESYIGQSVNLLNRLNDHLKSNATPSNQSLIANAIRYYGINNFMFQILELCNKEDLDWKEDYYIRLYRSNIYGLGYNVSMGGQNNIGASNPNSKLTEYDIYFIREAYNNHYDPNYIYNTYFYNKISYNSFFEIWSGKTWNNIHMDVDSYNNKLYHSNAKKSINPFLNRTNFTDEQVIEFRKRYVNETAEEIYKSVKPNCKFNTFRAILSGSEYRHLPVYNKKEKIWIYN